MKNSNEKQITKSSWTQADTYLFPLPAGRHLASLFGSKAIIIVFFPGKINQTKTNKQKPTMNTYRKIKIALFFLQLWGRKSLLFCKILNYTKCLQIHVCVILLKALTSINYPSHCHRLISSVPLQYEKHLGQQNWIFRCVCSSVCLVFISFGFVSHCLLIKRNSRIFVSSLIIKKSYAILVFECFVFL